MIPAPVFAETLRQALGGAYKYNPKLDAERARRARSGQRGRAEQRTRFEGEHFEVVIQHEALSAFRDEPRVRRDQPTADERVDGLRAETHIDAVADVGDRH